MTITTPPLAGMRLRISSGTLRATSQRARADEWLKMTGAWLASRASRIVSAEVCDRSTSIPSRFISATTRRPNEERPRDGARRSRVADLVGGVVGQGQVAGAEITVGAQRAQRTLEHVPALQAQQ